MQVYQYMYLFCIFFIVRQLLAFNLKRSQPYGRDILGQLGFFFQTGATISQLTRAYEVEFFQDMLALNISPPTALVCVTDHIEQIVAFVQLIIDNGLAYATDDGM